MLDSLITSKTRIKLILKFFLNSNTQSYLRGLAEEFDESTNSVRIELNRFAEAGLLEITSDGRKKMYKANKKHVLYHDLHSIVKKYIGIDQLIEEIVMKLGNVNLAIITGDYAQGIDTGLIDLIIVGDIDKLFLETLVNKSERLIRRKIRTLVLSNVEFKKLEEKLHKEKTLIIWSSSNLDRQVELD